MRVDASIPAFPLAAPSGEQYGMTLRDYFAGEAMKLKWDQAGTTRSMEYVAEAAYQMADAMLVARAK